MLTPRLPPQPFVALARGMASQLGWLVAICTELFIPTSLSDAPRVSLPPPSSALLSTLLHPPSPPSSTLLLRPPPPSFSTLLRPPYLPSFSTLLRPPSPPSSAPHAQVTICTEVRWRDFVLSKCADVTAGAVRFLPAFTS